MKSSNVLKAVGLVALGSAGVQYSASVAAQLFDSLGTLEVSGLRMLVSAAILLVLFRPTLRGRSRREWTGIVLFGLIIAFMNVSFYLAVERIPLGIAVTLEFLGPCAVALLHARKWIEGAVAVMALGGVALISLGPGGHFEPLGYLFGAMAAVGLASYTLIAARLGSEDAGFGGLALSITVAAIVTLPFSAPHLASVAAGQWWLVLVSAVLGVILPFRVDTVAAGLTNARIVGTIFAIDPVMGTLIGRIFMGQEISLSALAGILLVAAAGALLVWLGEGDQGGDHGAALGEAGSDDAPEHGQRTLPAV